jgi:hypothetical protein
MLELQLYLLLLLAEPGVVVGVVGDVVVLSPEPPVLGGGVAAVLLVGGVLALLLQLGPPGDLLVVGQPLPSTSYKLCTSLYLGSFSFS